MKITSSRAIAPERAVSNSTTSANVPPMVRAFFGAIPQGDFLNLLRRFSQGIGCSYNVVYCAFSSAKEDGSLAGTTFGALEESTTLSNADFLNYLEKVCAAYLSNNPEDSAVVNERLKTIKLKFPVSA